MTEKVQQNKLLRTRGTRRVYSIVCTRKGQELELGLEWFGVVLLERERKGGER